MVRRTLTLATFLLLTTSTVAQEAQQEAPAAANPSLPEVEVIQGQQPAQTTTPAAPKPKAAKPVAQKVKPKPPQQQQPAIQQDFPDSLPAEEPAPELANSPYGSPASGGAQARATQSAQTPVNPTQLLPSTLDGFSAAATHVSAQTLDENRPSNINEALTRVPGVIVINDDAGAHHGGVTLRGSPARRSRKMLVMEDGHAVNLALWLDPSVHMWGPLDRFESVEVLRGTVITHGPNNNFGVINGRNLSPFGPAESVISSAIGFTKTSRGSYADELEVDCDDGVCTTEPDDDATTTSKKDRTDLSYKWHAHTRQQVDNVGIVASYSGANLQGAWDTETLRFNDFYGALGFKGSSSDVVVSLTYTRQRDNYDEQNFLGEVEFDAANGEEAEDVANQIAGFAEGQFNQLKHCKSCFAPAAGLNNYNGEVWRGQVVHNAYVDDDTTITSRVYAGYHSRDRYQLNSYGSAPNGDVEADGSGAAYFIDDPENPGESIAIFGDNTMFGRLRTFRHIGAEVRGEWANQKLLGFNHTIQAGVRYEYQDMTNRNFIGAENEILKDGDKAGATIFDRELDANTVSAFLQTNVAVAQDFNVVPGIRFEWFQIGRQNRVVAREESEASGTDGALCDRFGSDECLSVDGLLLTPNPATESFSSFNALPGVAFAYTGLHKTTLFGGYHRGLTTDVLRNEDFPGKDEIGDNFNLGVRSHAFKGFDFEVVGFYQMLENYQYGASFSNVAGDRSFGRADEVEIGGVELYGRLNSQPFTGGSYNLYAESNYTYSRGTFKKLALEDEEGELVDFAGNRIPEVPLHVAALTLGIQQTTGWRWDASVTYTYRGAFFTDESNKAFGAGFELEPEGGGEYEVEEAGEDGGVPSVWLLSARFNLHLGETGASVFVSGENLTDELYISDREDGMKPGIGRTIWAGFKYKF